MRHLKIKSSNKSQSNLNNYGLATAIKHTRLILSLIGVWTMVTKNTTIIERRLSILIHFICQSILAFVIVPAIMQLLWREKNIKIKLAFLALVGYCIINSVKYWTIIYRRQEIKSCIDQMTKDWGKVRKKSEREIMMKNLKMGKKLTIFCANFMYCGGALHQLLMPLLPGSTVSIVYNSTRRLLIFPVYDVLFDDQITPVYEILYFIHFIIGIIVCTISIGASHLSILFVTHMTGQSEIVIFKLKNVIAPECDENRNINERICDIINHYDQIIKFSSNVELCLREICLIGMLEALFVICLCQYYTIEAWRNNEDFATLVYFFLVGIFIFNCFIFCYVGELSKEQFQKANEAVYTTEWYRLSQKNARAIILIIAITQNPPKITAGGLMELSYEGFLSIIKTTAAYFNILRMIEL